MPPPIASAGLAAVISLALCTAVVAQSADWRHRRIDASSEAEFERSITTLQSSLSPRRREAFDIALALVWMSESLGSTGLDLDLDGDVDHADTRVLVDETMDLFTGIERGELLPSIDKLATSKPSEYTVANFLQQLHGLTWENVLELAGRPSRVSAASLRRAAAQRRLRLNPPDSDYGVSSFRALMRGGLTQKPRQ
ncbi:MAG TPA: hypothetical protein VFO94_00385 [Gammaproteobacteria bacterium]|nr:hypothetical protein [Gammaproteobacteria bacterium]